MSTFAPPKPNHEGECQFVRVARIIERCSLPGCPVGRYSREWLDSLKRRTVSASANVLKEVEPILGEMRERLGIDDSASPDLKE